MRAGGRVQAGVWLAACSFPPLRCPDVRWPYTAVGIEVCPISNQVLKLVADLRNHPLVQFASLGLPATLSPDDPALWGAVGSSHDWAMAFFALGETAGLAMLKQLAMNSVLHSALDPEEKASNLLTWRASWNSFVDSLAADADADSAVASCGTNLDCSLNGVCSGGVCICDKPWTGPSCGRLAYNKTTPKTGQSLFPINRTHNTWNGPIMGPTPDGKFHLFDPCKHNISNCQPTVACQGCRDALAILALHSSESPHFSVCAAPVGACVVGALVAWLLVTGRHWFALGTFLGRLSPYARTRLFASRLHHSMSPSVLLC